MNTPGQSINWPGAAIDLGRKEKPGSLIQFNYLAAGALAPLGDWQSALKDCKIPVVEDAGSDIAGAIQQLFSGAQRVLLYDIQISGTTTKPAVTEVPAPVISQPVAAIFGQLIRGDKDAKLIEKVRIQK